MESTADDMPVSLATLLDAGGACTSPLDAAADYWRIKADRLLPLYVLAMGPHAIVTGLLIAAINGEQRSLASRYCFYLTAATLWRWVWIAWLQRRVQEDLRARSTAGILVARSAHSSDSPVWQRRYQLGIDFRGRAGILRFFSRQLRGPTAAGK